MQLSQEDLSLIKKLELEIAIEIKRICEKHDIHYSIAFGTLLGAVRHGGFIPWDDDIDIAMLRFEYDKFLFWAEKDMDAKFEIVNYESDSNMGEPFTKIMLKNTTVLEKFAKNSNGKCGVFVDVFSYDNAPKGIIARNLHRFLNYSLRKRILLASNYSFNKMGMKRVIYFLLRSISFGKKQKLVNQYRKNQNRYNHINSEYIVALGGNYGYIKDTIPKEWFTSYQKIIFENVEFSAIEKTDEFLKHYYGDYKQLPPIEKRINKHTIEVLDLTKYGGRKIETTD